MEGEGFEPPEDLSPRWFSRPVHSARLCHPSIDFCFMFCCNEFTDLNIRVFNFNQLFSDYSIIVCLLSIRPRVFVIFEVFISYRMDSPRSTQPVYLSSNLCIKAVLLIKYSFRFLFFNFRGICVIN